jgi:hypothetical protein
MDFEWFWYAPSLRDFDTEYGHNDARKPLSNGRPCARLRYSDFCLFAPVTRYYGYDPVKVQLEETVDAHGKPDWEMLYTPGPKALMEYKAFTSRSRLLPPAGMAPKAITISPAQQEELPLTAAADSPLFLELTRRGISPKKARELLAHLSPARKSTTSSNTWIRWCRRTRAASSKTPRASTSTTSGKTSRPRRNSGAAANAASAARHAQLALDYDDYRRQETQRYIDAMPFGDYQQLYEQFLHSNRIAFKLMTPEQLHDITERTVQAELRDSGKIPFLSFESFCQKPQPSLTGKARKP